jgi:hypothetical protein
VLTRLIRNTVDLIRGIDRAQGEEWAREVGSYHALYRFLENHTDVGCPWCGVHDPENPHHASDCELVAKAHGEGF